MQHNISNSTLGGSRRPAKQLDRLSIKQMEKKVAKQWSLVGLLCECSGGGGGQRNLFKNGIGQIV